MGGLAVRHTSTVEPARGDLSHVTSIRSKLLQGSGVLVDNLPHRFVLVALFCNGGSSARTGFASV